MVELRFMCSCLDPFVEVESGKVHEVQSLCRCWNSRPRAIDSIGLTPDPLVTFDGVVKRVQVLTSTVRLSRLETPRLRGYHK